MAVLNLSTSIYGYQRRHFIILAPFYYIGTDILAVLNPARSIYKKLIPSRCHFIKSAPFHVLGADVVAALNLSTPIHGYHAAVLFHDNMGADILALLNLSQSIHSAP